MFQLYHLKANVPTSGLPQNTTADVAQEPPVIQCGHALNYTAPQTSTVLRQETAETVCFFLPCYSAL